VSRVATCSCLLQLGGGRFPCRASIIIEQTGLGLLRIPSEELSRPASQAARFSVLRRWGGMHIPCRFCGHYSLKPLSLVQEVVRSRGTARPGTLPLHIQDPVAVEPGSSVRICRLLHRNWRVPNGAVTRGSPRPPRASLRTFQSYSRRGAPRLRHGGLDREGVGQLGRGRRVGQAANELQDLRLAGFGALSWLLT
jgi:hypothetical protein